MRHHIFLERCCPRVLINRLAGIAMLACVGGQAALTPEAASQIRDLTSLEEVSELFGTPGPGVPIQELVPTGDPHVFDVVSRRVFEAPDGTIGIEEANAGLLVINHWYGSDPFTSFSISGNTSQGFDIPELCPYQCPDDPYDHTGDFFRIDFDRASADFHAASGEVFTVGGIVGVSEWSFAEDECPGDLIIFCAETVGSDDVMGEDPAWQRPLRHLREDGSKKLQDAYKLFRKFHRDHHRYLRPALEDGVMQPWEIEVFECQRQFYEKFLDALSLHEQCMQPCSTKESGFGWWFQTACWTGIPPAAIGAPVGCAGGGAGGWKKIKGGIKGAAIGFAVGAAAGSLYCYTAGSPRANCEALCDAEFRSRIIAAIDGLRRCADSHRPIGRGR